MKKYFGTDGIRGKVNQEITPSLLNKIGQSLSYLNVNTVYLGYDTRISNKMLLHCIAGGALSVGITCIDLGVISTPALAYLSYSKKIVCLMLTASHNYYDDNGVKIFINGYKLTDYEEMLLEYSIENNLFPSSNKIGNSYTDKYAYYDYLRFINNFSFKSTKKIALDFANGALYQIGKEIYNKVANDLVIIGDKPNGKNINHLGGATYPAALKQICQNENCDIGFCFDGDGDRIIVVDQKRIYYGNEIIYLIAKYLKAKNKLNKQTVVLTKDANLGIINSFKKEGIDVELVDTGDKFVFQTLKKNNLALGGENSGHIILPAYLVTGDGLLNSLIILYILDYFQASLSDLTADLLIYPEKLINIKTNNKQIIKQQVIQDYLNSYLLNYQGVGSINIRASGTENLIRIYICHQDIEVLEKEEIKIRKLVNALLEKEEEL